MAPSLASGIAALRRFHRPFILIQLAAALVVISYHYSSAVRAFCGTVATIKTAGGLPFAALAASIAGGIFPELANLIGAPRRYTLKGRVPEILFNLAFFAFNGIVIDFLYRGEARLFGVDSTIGTIAKKAAFDQLVFTPLWLPLIIALYLWRHEGFSATATVAILRLPGFYRTRVVPLLLPAWFFWIPMVCVTYALPVTLQLVLFTLALGAWSLIMVFIADASAGKRATAAPSVPCTS